jgi:hypothetical protein
MRIHANIRILGAEVEIGTTLANSGQPYPFTVLRTIDHNH